MKLSFLFPVLLFSTLLQPVKAQFSKEIKDQFFQVMLAFPSRFESIKGASMKLDKHRFYSKVTIGNTQYCMIDKNNETGNPVMVANIFSSESVNMAEFRNKFEEWKKNIDQLDLGGALLTDYPNDKYKINRYDMYVEGKAWRIESVKQSIDQKYKSFTIRLELLDLDQGGLMLQMVFGED